MRLADFALDPSSGVHVAPEGVRPAGYLDGVEGRLAAALADTKDLSVYSDELRAHVDDWPTLYHLTPYRSTLLDAFGWTGAPASVLELGAGCGAVTRWLGEHCGEVHAIEGDADRARVARLRTRDLEHVSVYAGNFSDLAEERRFDVATYIGVLEYGHLYHPRHPHDADPAALENLQMARRALVDDGVLILAIENKLGMKYFNGAPEDHSARAYDGIQGYPRSTGAKTWSARELERLLTQAGFATSEWFLPFPDYKLADTILNGELASDEHRLHNWIGTPAPARGVDRGGIQFNETLAFREAAGAGLLVPLSNSFLVLAYAGDAAATRARLGIDVGWVARHWSLTRRRPFQKRVTLHEADGALVVDHDPIHDAPAPAPALPLTQQLGREDFARGDLALLDVMETFAIGLPEDVMLEHVRELRDHLLATYGTGLVDGDGVPLVDGGALDASWWNVVRDPETGTLQTIDAEWAVDAPLPVDYVLWRALFYLAGRYQGHIPPHHLPFEDFAVKWTRLVFPEVTDERVVWFTELEMAIGEAVGVGVTGDLSVLEGLRDRPRSAAVLALAAEVAERPELLRAYAEQIGAGDDVTLLLHAAADEASTVVPALQDAIAAAGLADGGPDMLLLPRPAAADDDLRSLAARSRALLSERTPPAPLAGVPVVGAAEAATLRELAGLGAPR